MDKITKKLISILREDGVISVESDLRLNIPGLGELTNGFWNPGIDLEKIKDLKKFKKYLCKNPFKLRIYEIGRDLDEPGETAGHMIFPYENKIGCNMHPKKDWKELGFGDNDCKLCKYYEGKNKCLAREYETAKN